MKILEATSLSHHFEYTLFEHIELSLYPGETMAIVGESGSGKSTLLHTLSTLLKPNEGVVKLLDSDIYKLKERELVALRRDELGLIFQSHYLFKGFSASRCDKHESDTTLRRAATAYIYCPCLNQKATYYFCRRANR
jgi:putative ABC transport system ATP-binding protein